MKVQFSDLMENITQEEKVNSYKALVCFEKLVGGMVGGTDRGAFFAGYAVGRGLLSVDISTVTDEDLTEILSRHTKDVVLDPDPRGGLNQILDKLKNLAAQAQCYCPSCTRNRMEMN